VHDRFPIIDKPASPNLSKVTLKELKPLDEEVKGKVLDNIKELRIQVKQYEAAVNTYNAAAKAHNEDIKAKRDKKDSD